VSQYQKGKTNLDFNEARDSEWQWQHPATQFLQAGRPPCCPTKALKARSKLLLKNNCLLM